MEVVGFSSEVLAELLEFSHGIKGNKVLALKVDALK